jgi:hypothetical protein
MRISVLMICLVLKHVQATITESYSAIYSKTLGLSLHLLPWRHRHIWYLETKHIKRINCSLRDIRLGSTT